MIDPAPRRAVIPIDESQFNHIGGQLAFRASDQYIYISLGDGGNANDVGDGHNPVKGNAQDKKNVLGKLLRIDPLDPGLDARKPGPNQCQRKVQDPRERIRFLVGISRRNLPLWAEKSLPLWF